MCEEHSPFSNKQVERKKRGLKNRIMPFGLIESTIKEAITTGLKEIIPSTMGEPLLYDHFELIIDLCHRYNIKMNLTTNGTFPRRPVIDWAEMIAPVCSDIKISLNGSNRIIHESIMLRSKFDSLIEHIKQFKTVRDKIFNKIGHYCRITIQTTFMEKNLGDQQNIALLAISLGVDRLKGHHLWPHFPEIANLSLRKNHDSIRRWNAILPSIEDVVQKNRLSNGNRLILENFHPLNPQEPDELIKDGTCPFLGKEAWINTYGRFNPCCAPDDQRQSLGDFGILPRRTLRDIWDSEKYYKLMKTYKSIPLCQSCNMKKMEA